MKFLPLTPHDFATYKPFFENQAHPLCIYSLSSIIAWRHETYYLPYVAVCGDSLIVCAEFADKKENRHLILPISPGGDHTPDELRELALDIGARKYSYVPQDYVEKYGFQEISHFFDIEEQTGFMDYIYLTEDLSGLKGNKYSKKRNLINQFKGRYLDKGRVKIEPISSDLWEEYAAFLKEWCRERGCDEDNDKNLFCERQAIKNAVNEFELLQMKGIVLRIDEKVCALGMSSHLTRDMAALHFEKAFSDIKGLYQYFDRECARRLFNGYRYLNKESDMGLPGLAKAKKSYHPVMFVKSYKLQLR